MNEADHKFSAPKKDGSIYFIFIKNFFPRKTERDSFKMLKQKLKIILPTSFLEKKPSLVIFSNEKIRIFHEDKQENVFQLLKHFILNIKFNLLPIVCLNL